MKKVTSKLWKNILRNLPWKLAAFFMAVGLWFVIINLVDPVSTTTISVQLQLLNEDVLTDGSDHIHIANIAAVRNQTVSITVSGTLRSIEETRDSLVAYIDLSTFDIVSAARNAEDISITIHTAGLGNVDQVAAPSPSSINLVMDTIIEREFSVGVEPTGEVPEEFIQMQEFIIVTPDVLTVRGPSRILNRIEHLVRRVDIDGETITIFEADSEVWAFDTGGGRVTSQHMHIGTVDVEIPIFRRGRIHIFPPLHYIGTFPEGYGLYEMDWYPRYVDVAGEEDAIAAVWDISPIRLNAIQAEYIEGRIENFTVPVNFLPYLPPGVFLIDPDQHMVYVDMFVEPYVQQIFVIPSDYFNITGRPQGAAVTPDTTVTVLTEEITLTLTALRSVMAGIGDITPTAFLGNQHFLIEGERDVSFDFGLPAGVRIVGDTPRLAFRIDNLMPNEYGDDDEENGYEESYDDEEIYEDEGTDEDEEIEDETYEGDEEIEEDGEED